MGGRCRSTDVGHTHYCLKEGGFKMRDMRVHEILCVEFWVCILGFGLGLGLGLGLVIFDGRKFHAVVCDASGKRDPNKKVMSRMSL